MFDTLIAGFGHAGRDLHLPTMGRLRKMRGATRPIGAVDPLMRASASANVLVRANLESLLALYPPQRTVVHICTPPDAHANTLAEYVTAGYRRFLIEKPLVASREDLRRVGRICEQNELQVLVAANWLFSRLTEAVAEYMRSRAGIPLLHMELRSTKSRIRKSIHSRVHSSAFEVEMPHLVALALRLCGAGLCLTDASSNDLVLGDRRVQMMASADIFLCAPGGYPVHLLTDLISPLRERSIQIAWEDGHRLAGFYPVDSTDLYSYLECSGPNGAVREQCILEDDTLLSFFSQAYRHFETDAPAPDSGLAFHDGVIDLLIQAQDLCGESIRSGPRERREALR